MICTDEAATSVTVIGSPTRVPAMARVVPDVGGGDVIVTREPQRKSPMARSVTRQRYGTPLPAGPGRHSSHQFSEAVESRVSAIALVEVDLAPAALLHCHGAGRLDTRRQLQGSRRARVRQHALDTGH